ncbi:PDDEXK family nuclease [Gimesia panareensis]|uniref:hypothetical protein n=1 Tax=Gimesia panareensis TaxID=2527978 RepID=UPI0011A27E09|nr:hypothetical protein [Gimesia panareensis]
MSDSKDAFNRVTYRSESERIVAGIFEEEDIRFKYEAPLSVDVDDKGYQERRTWHPDFYIHDLDVIVEYVGLPDDEEYMEGIHKKEKVYEEMGLKVAWIYPEDIWDESNGKYWKKENASEMVLNKVYEAARSGSAKSNLYGFGRDYGKQKRAA